MKCSGLAKHKFYPSFSRNEFKFSSTHPASHVKIPLTLQHKMKDNSYTYFSFMTVSVKTSFGLFNKVCMRQNTFNTNVDTAHTKD
jgi:hypothetical protein